MANMGTIKNFNAEKGFGFIVGADGSDIFVHIKSCTDGGVPQKGDIVSYDKEESKLKPGQMQASNVTGGTGMKGGGKGGKGPQVPGAFQGTCKNFNAEKGFGFIVGADGTDIFMHIKAVVDGSQPQQGDMLSYDMEPSRTKPGQMQATNVSGGTGWGGGGGGGCYGKADSWGMKGGKGGPYGGGGWDAGKGDSWGGKGGKGDSWGMKGGKGDSWGGDGGWNGDGGKGGWGADGGGATSWGAEDGNSNWGADGGDGGWGGDSW